MEVGDTRFVEFQKYCSKCKHRNVGTLSEPCCECMSHSTNYHSERPVKYEEDLYVEKRFNKPVVESKQVRILQEESLVKERKDD